MTFSERLRRLKLIAFDFDGVFTDGKVIVSDEGVESVVCSRRDTLRFPEFQALGVDLVVMTNERNPVVSKRCQKLQIPCHQGLGNKLETLERICKEKNLTADSVAYVGDDINDLECLKWAKMAIVVADGDDECKKVAGYITKRIGGDHAVREICDLILESLQGR